MNDTVRALTADEYYEYMKDVFQEIRSYIVKYSKHEVDLKDNEYYLDKLVQNEIEEISQKVEFKKRDELDVMIGQIDALTDFKYFLYGSYTYIGIDPENSLEDYVSELFEKEDTDKWLTKTKIQILEVANKHFGQVYDFHKVFNHPVHDEPTLMPHDVFIQRVKWKIEEVLEGFSITVDSIQEFKEMALLAWISVDYSYQNRRELLSKKIIEDDLLKEQTSLFAKCIYLADYQIAGNMNLVGEDFFDIVHEANMGKLWPDGKVHYRESDNKIVKPDNWEEDFAPEPKIKDRILSQSKSKKEFNNNKKKYKASEDLARYRRRLRSRSVYK